jgi:ABC-type branched-subunit amino acid transport system substrate-binding protein
MRQSFLAASVAAFSIAAAVPGLAQETINVGLSGALTGPSAGSYAPAVEGLRLYVDKVNKAGGIAGKRINLVIQDDQGQPSRGAANAKKLLTQDNVALLINASLSATYAPMIQEAQRAGVPLLFAGAVCPKEVYPPAQDLLYCTTAFAAQYDSRATLEFVKKKASGPVKLGLAAMAIPVSRGEIDFAEELAKQMGMEPVDKEVVPPPTADYTPFGTKLQQSGANWIYAWAPWVTEVKTFEAVRKLGWDGEYITWAHLEAEGDLGRLKDGKLYAIGANSLFNEKLPVHEEITQAAKAAGTSYAADQMVEGWVAGLVIEAALKGAASPDKLKDSMNALNVDTKGLRGGPIQWTKDNHFRTKQYYRVYRWSPEKNGIEVLQDWMAYDVK